MRLLSLTRMAKLHAALLLLPACIFSETHSPSPVPIWSGKGPTPKSYGKRRVFLSPDEHSVILLWPEQNGSESRVQRLALHNEIYPSLRVEIKQNSGAFVYTYDLENGKESKDSINTFSIVIYPDRNLQAGAELWRGMKSTAIVGKRIGIPGAPDGGLVLWSSPDAQPLLPGKVTKFTLTSEASPGFTMAATEHYPHLGLTDEWPEQILDELEPVLTPSWIDQHIVTFGPRYRSDESPSHIAADYASGIRELIRKGQLQPNSSFVKEVIAGLAPISRGSSVRFVVTEKPQSDLEKEMLNALQLSLHITAKSP